MKSRWQLRVRKEALRGLLQQDIDPLDAATLEKRLRELMRQLLASRGTPPKYITVHGSKSECRRWMHDRLAVEYMIITHHTRRWLTPWRLEQIQTIEITFVFLVPGSLRQ